MGDYFFGITDKGKRRETNEDTFIARELVTNELAVACVIDGVGGYSGGEIAASIAQTVILGFLEDVSGDITATLETAIIAANDAILEEKSKDRAIEQMACVLTCAIADIKNNKLYYAHVGDTRLYLQRDHSLVKLSKDHSVVGFLEESGRLSEEEAMRHPRRNEITKALGFEENINDIGDFIEKGESPFLPGDVILVCSDGLSDMISSTTMLNILLGKNNLSKKAAELVDAANDAGGNDNITAVLVQNNNQPIPKVALKPIDRKSSIEKSPQKTNASPEQTTKLPVRRKRSFIALLIFVSIGLVAMALFQNATPVKKNRIILKPAVKKPKNEQQELLLPGVIDSTKKYQFATTVKSISLSQPIAITKDSFYLKGNGTTIIPDSGYHEPAIVINKKAKVVVLDSITFKNFDVAVVIQRNNVVFKNVRFVNCRVPVQYQLSFPDTTISGRIKDSIFFTLPVKKHTK